MDDAALTIWLCEQLGEIEGWQWWPEPEPYPADIVGVNVGAIPADVGRAVGVRIFGGTDDEVTGTKTRRAQVRFRGDHGDPLGANALADAAFTRFRRLMREGVVSTIIRTSFAPSGESETGREERTDSYLIIFDNEEAPS